MRKFVIVRSGADPDAMLIFKKGQSIVGEIKSEDGKSFTYKGHAIDQRIIVQDALASEDIDTTEFINLDEPAFEMKVLLRWKISKNTDRLVFNVSVAGILKASRCMDDDALQVFATRIANICAEQMNKYRHVTKIEKKKQ